MSKNIFETPYHFLQNELSGESVEYSTRSLGDLKGIFSDEEAFEAMDKEIRTRVTSSDLESFISYDGDAQLHELTPEFFDYLTKLSPFGHSNPKPVYRFSELRVVRCSPVGGGAHTRGTFSGRMGQMDFIAFNRPVSMFQDKLLDVLATPQLNKHMNVETAQLNIVDVRDVY